MPGDYRSLYILDVIIGAIVYISSCLPFSDFKVLLTWPKGSIIKCFSGLVLKKMTGLHGAMTSTLFITVPG